MATKVKLTALSAVFYETPSGLALLISVLASMLFLCSCSAVT